MKKFLFLLVLTLPLAYAQVSTLPSLDVVKEDYNSNLEEVPKFIKSLIGTERINAYITLDNGTDIAIKATTEEGLVKQLAYGELDDPTLVARTSEETVAEILNAEDSLQRLEEALDNKEITYEATSLKKKIKWGATSVILKVASWLNRILR